MDFRCHNCGEAGHYARDCPALLPGTIDGGQASSARFDDHLERISGHVRDWWDGKTSIDQKRQRISDENKSFYGSACPRNLMWPH